MKQNYILSKSMNLIKKFTMATFLFSFSFNYAQNETTLTLLDSYDIDDVGEPSGLAYDATNNQLFAVSDSDDIFRLSVTGNVLDSYDFSADLEGVTVYDTNTLLIAVEDTYELIEYNYLTGNSTSHTMDYDNQDDSGSGIEGVTYNPSNGEIYFLNEKDPAALIVANSNFNVTDEYELSFSGDLSASSYVNETGFLWLGSDEESTVYKCDTQGNVVEAFPLEDDGDELDKIEGMAIDYDNQLLYLVTDGDARLYVYSISEETTTTTEDNLALNGSASQSTTGYNGVASRAIDGDTNGAYNNASVTHTRATTGSWWQVVLSEQTNIGDIIIYNRTDCCTSRLSNFTISIVDNNNDTVYSETFTETPSPSLTINADDVLGRTIRVASNLENTALSLAEVEVYEGKDNDGGSSSCTSGTNLSLNSTVVDFSDQENTTNSADNINDEEDGNRWSAFGFSQYVTLDLGDEYSVNEINLLTFQDRDYQFIVEGSTSSATNGFSTLVDASSNKSSGPINRTFSSQTVRYVKLTVLGADDYSGSWVSIHDFEVICAGSTSNKNVLSTVKSNAFNVTAYPNPFTSVVNVESNDSNQTFGNVQLVDLSGKIITNQSSINGLEVGLDNLDVANGVYLLQIFNTENELIKVIKLIKE